MLSITLLLEKIGIVFLILLFLVGVCLMYFSIIYDPVITRDSLLDNGIISAHDSIYDPEILKEILHTTGILLLAVSSIPMGFILGKEYALKHVILEGLLYDEIM